MTTAEFAATYAALCRSWDDEAGLALHSADTLSVESFPGPHQEVRGREALRAKYAEWNATTQVFGVKVEGPFVNGDQFSMIYELDAQMEGMPRMTMREVALYTVKDGLIIEERFFGAPMG